MLIPRAVLDAVPICKNQIQTQYALKGVQIERGMAHGKCFAVATDGHRMLSVEWDDAELRKHNPEIGGVETEPVDGFSAIVDARACKAVAKSAKPTKRASAACPVLDWIAIKETGPSEPRALQAGAYNGTDTAISSMPTLAGSFPRWRDIIPDYSEGQVSYDTLNEIMKGCKFHPSQAHVRVKVDAQKFGEMLLAIAKMYDDPHNEVEMFVSLNPGAALVVRKEDEAGKAVGVLMPLVRK